MIYCFFLAVNTSTLHAQTVQEITTGDEITIEMWHKEIGSTVIPCILDGKFVFVQLQDVFAFVKVRADLFQDKELITGFYINEVNTYEVDLKSKTIQYHGEKTHLKPEEYRMTPTGKYIRIDVIQKIFDLKCEFDFNDLGLELRSDNALPAETEMQSVKQRQNIRAQNDDFIPDRNYPLHRSWFSLGSLDWSASGSYSTLSRQYSYNLMGGGQIIGGDFDASISGNSNSRLDLANSPWELRYNVQNSSLISQILIGKHASFSNIHLADTMVGIQISNASNAYRSSFSTYTISDYTEPNWTVELYINEGLMNYVKADQTGFYQFAIPLAYGSTNVTLKFKGPYGEVRTKTTQLQIPYTFLPPGELEYTLTGGTSLQHPNIKNTTGRLDLKLGISTAMTLAGGMHYKRDSIGGVLLKPFASSSLRLSSRLLLGGEYYHESGFRSTMSFSGPLGIAMDLSYDHPFHSASVAIDEFTITDQRKLQLTTPFPFLTGSIRISATDIPLTSTQSTFVFTSQAVFNLFGITTDVSANYNFLRNKWDLINNGGTGSAGLSFVLPGAFVMHPSVSIDYTNKKIVGGDCSIQKTIGEFGTLNITANHSFEGNTNHIQADFHIPLSFAQFGAASGGGTAQPVSTSASMQGSVIFDPTRANIIVTDRPQVRRGGIEIVPFLDLNSNQQFDPGETLVKHFSIDQPPGRVIEQNNGILHVIDLEPYKKYVIKTSTGDLENISWTPTFQSFDVVPPANGFARVEIPLTIAGQIEGYVFFAGIRGNEPLGGARIKIRHHELNDSSEVKTTEELLTYSSGEFYYLGLTPGKYRAYIDPKQLALLHYTADHEYIDFEMHFKDEGDVVQDLNFVLKAHSDAITKAK